MNLEKFVDALEAAAHMSGGLAGEVERLRMAVDRSQARFEEAVNRLNVPGITDDLAWAADETARLQVELAEATLQLAEAKADLEAEEQVTTLRWKQSDEAGKPDPSTGRTNKAYSEMLLEQHLASRASVTDLRGSVRGLEATVSGLRAELEGARARFSAARHKARLTASMLVFMSEPARSLGRMETMLADNNRTEWKEEV